MLRLNKRESTRITKRENNLQLKGIILMNNTMSKEQHNEQHYKQNMSEDSNY